MAADQKSLLKETAFYEVSPLVFGQKRPKKSASP